LQSVKLTKFPTFLLVLKLNKKNGCFMKKVLMLAFLFGSAISVHAQLVLSTDSQLIVNSGSVVVANDVTCSGGTIKNNGDVSVLGDITNNDGALMDATSSGTLTFEGSSAQEITGTASCTFYGTVDINNSNGVALTNTSTGNHQTIAGTLNFTSGKLTLNGFNLTLGATDPTGADASAYIVTNSSGGVLRSVPADGATNVLFPVGNSTYNPLALQNSATATTDNYSVKVTDSKPANFTGTTHIVNRSWVVTEEAAGGSDLTVTTQWSGSQELTDFDRTSSAVGTTPDNGTTVTWGSSSAASGSDPYANTTAGITSTGIYMVGDAYYSGLVVDLQAFLAGAYNTTNHNMDKTLNALLPLTDPYDGTTTVASIPATAVDWIKVELRDTDRATVLHSFARFIDQNGQIINEDGTDCKMTGVTTGSYYIAILHRNHFGVVSNSTVNLAGSPSLSFKSAQATAWQDVLVSTNAAMKEVETSVFALWDGDANGDGEVQYEGGDPDRVSILNAVGVSTPTNIINSTYSSNDVNLDGNVQYEGGNPDRVSVLNVIGVSTPTRSFSAHIPE
jgi:hypothetical protein